jgi:hypothetical protein
MTHKTGLMARTALGLSITLVVLLLVGCAETPSELVSRPESDWTGITELDHVIEIVLAGDTEELRSIVSYTQTACTFEDGLGGPPKCAEGEAEGKFLEVLPILGPEGHFIRREDIGSWEGLNVSDLFAVYAVSDSAYAEPNYPKGMHAIVFINEIQSSSVTLHIAEGQIVRLDFGFVLPPQIPDGWVEKYLLPPQLDA